MYVVLDFIKMNTEAQKYFFKVLLLVKDNPKTYMELNLTKIYVLAIVPPA